MSQVARPQKTTVTSIQRVGKLKAIENILRINTILQAYYIRLLVDLYESYDEK